MKSYYYFKFWLPLLLAISLMTVYSSCDKENPHVPTFEETFVAGDDTHVSASKMMGGVSVSSVYCLWDLISGNPSPDGCWTLISVPEGSTIDQGDLDGSWNPCIEFSGQPCPGVYVFEYSTSCECENCAKKSTLTINLACDCDQDLVVSINCQNNGIPAPPDPANQLRYYEVFANVIADTIDVSGYLNLPDPSSMSEAEVNLRIFLSSGSNSMRFKNTDKASLSVTEYRINFPNKSIEFRDSLNGKSIELKAYTLQ